MMGTQQTQDNLFSYHVNLSARIRENHPLRRVLSLVDFTFVRQEVSALYGSNGNSSVDPSVIMKMMFLLFFDNVHSERELMRIIPERLDYLWFLGYGLDDVIPDHSVLSKARRRWGAEVFQTLFERIVEQCLLAGLIEGSKLHMDGSVIDANVSLDSVKKGSPELIKQLKEAWGAVENKLDEDPQQKSREPARKRTVCKTDPDAASMIKGPGPARPRYKQHRAVDNALGVITAVETTPADVTENHKLMDLVDQHEKLTGKRVGAVIADSQYGTVENFRSCHERGIKSHMADLKNPKKPSKRHEGIFHDTAFTYDNETDTYLCPAGEKLHPRRYHKRRKMTEYIAKKETCAACILREQCTRSKSTGRTIGRHLKQETIDKARAQSHSGEAKRNRKRRNWLMEGSFADAANNHGFKRARWRRLWRQQIQDYLIAAVQNVRIMINRKNLKPAHSMAGLVRLTKRFESLMELYKALSRPLGFAEGLST